MKYAAPQIVPGGSALAAIQGIGKPNHFNLDNTATDKTYDCSVPAYEADE